MQIYRKEKLSNPDLFTGRSKELAYFKKWVDGIRQQVSPSTAILSRRKTGKSALLERLYNLIFDENDLVVPFFFEIEETDQWIIDFSKNFFLTFIYQYFAFKSRKIEYISGTEKTFTHALETAKKEGLDYLTGLIEEVQVRHLNEEVNLLWSTVRDAPRNVAGIKDERVVQLIDEFQFLNRFIYRDKSCTERLTGLAGSYLGTAEYRNAPLLVSGSWVGWLMDDLNKQLPGRFRKTPLEELPQAEAVEMIFKYAYLKDTPVTETTAYLMAELSEGNPFYISSLFDSNFKEKDLTTEDGLLKTLEYETNNRWGWINSTWMEYIETALQRINDKNAKSIVIYLSKHRDREVSRKELLENLNLVDMNERELEQRLTALAYSDIIEHGRSNFYYRGVQDNIFDKVFRSWYADDIQEFDPQEITNEYKAMFEAMKAKFNQLSGTYNHFKGKFAEYLIINHLHYRAREQSDLFKSMMENLPIDFEFAEYKSVWSYVASPVHKRDIQIDLFARAAPHDYSLIGEVKNRETMKFSLEEATLFVKKAVELRELEQVGKALLFVFCRAGFPEQTLEFFRQNEIAWSEDVCWMENVI